MKTKEQKKIEPPVHMTKSQARAVARILNAYADGKKTQWRWHGGDWIDGKIAIQSRAHVEHWLSTHRIKGTEE